MQVSIAWSAVCTGLQTTHAKLTSRASNIKEAHPPGLVLVTISICKDYMCEVVDARRGSTACFKSNMSSFSYNNWHWGKSMHILTLKFSLVTTKPHLYTTLLIPRTLSTDILTSNLPQPTCDAYIAVVTPMLSCYLPSRSPQDVMGLVKRLCFVWKKVVYTSI